MKAAIFEKPGLENLKIQEDILIEVKAMGVNPIDHFVISGSREIKPQSPHIPGAEHSMEHVICVLMDVRCYAEVAD
jgi:NADPH:quinone reductase-like Zn-dependent oxidoreductase